MQAVTVLISRKTKLGCEPEFERVMGELISAASAFKGYLGAQLVRPGEEEGVNDSFFHIVLAFDSEVNLKAWQESPARALGWAAAAPYIEGPTVVRPLTGLAHWFQTAGGHKQVPPPRWKVAVVTWLGIFPTVYLLFLAMEHVLAPWPLLGRIMLITVLVVALMTWVVAPTLTQLLKPWLYPSLK